MIQTFKLQKSLLGLSYSRVLARFSTSKKEEGEENLFKNFQPKILDPKRIDYYKSLRIYSEDSFFMLLNRLLLCTILKVGPLVKNANKLYTFASKIIGYKIPDTLMKWTVGKVFTGGEDVNHTIQYTKQVDTKKIKVIFDYCCEAIADLSGEQLLDRNADVLEQSVIAKSEVARIQQKNEKDVLHICGLKVTGICDLQVLKDWNKATTTVWELYNKMDEKKEGKLNGQEVLDGLNKLGYKVSEEEFMQFAKDILKMETQDKKIEELEITSLDWRIYVHALYIEAYENDNAVIRKLAPFTKDQFEKLNNYNKRVEKIMKAAVKTETRCLFDAEQTYLQAAIDSSTELVQRKYNTSLPLAINTFQNYLKSTKGRIDYEIAKYQKLNHIVGLKMVRGAYMTEEREIAQKTNIPSPIWENKEGTDKLMDYNCLRLAKVLQPPSQLLVGSHNEVTIEKLIMQMEKFKINKQNVIFSQLKGLADHITFTLAKEGYNVFKWSPYGEAHIMIPYLLRRSEEQYLMFGIVKLQEQLIRDELKRRILCKK